MNNMIEISLRSLAVLALIFSLTACDRPEAPMPRAGATDIIDAAQRPGHTTETADYILRASSIDSQFLSAQMIQQYGIEAAPNRGLLNVVILRKNSEGKNQAVSARIDARYQNLIGQSDSIELRKVEANERVSYVGSFDVEAEGTFRFSVEAQPEGSEATLTLEFEDRFTTAE